MNGSEFPLSNISNYDIEGEIDKISIPIYTTFGIIGNILSFSVLVSSSLIKSTTCMYMIVIAVLDTTILIINAVSFFSGLRRRIDIVCKMTSCLFYFAIHFVTLLIVVMTGERYLVVKHPLKATAWITRTRTKKIICLVGLFSFFLNVHHVVIRKVVMDANTGKLRCLYEGEMNVFFMSKIYPWIDSFVYCFFPLTSLCILNILIVKSLRNSKNNLDKYETSGAVKPKQQRQITMMLILVSVAFLLFAGPIGIMLVLTQYSWFPKTAQEWGDYYLVETVARNLMYINHSMNFILYVVSGQKFRGELRRLFSRLLVFRHQSNTKITPRQRQIYICHDNVRPNRDV
ncbi:hypothetical protein SNE40_012342 [Patella caerulea]|uniref:G-protein coupled receptors family 1 profile domain-containing protein n=1 Tax=Patella caerulea TaxID=87958 RepID=A0AAN8JLK2_PATCE